MDTVVEPTRFGVGGGSASRGQWRVAT